MACDSQGQQNDFEKEADLPPKGFTTTDENGQVVTEDKDDWRTSPFFLGKILVEPAFPNPTNGEVVNVTFNVLEFDAVGNRMVLRGRDPNGRLSLLDEIENASEPGAHTFRFAPGLLGQKGLHRLFIFDTVGDLVSYGDLMLQ